MMITSVRYAINTPEARRYPMWVRLRNNCPMIWWLWMSTWP